MFWVHHLFVPLTRFIPRNGDMRLVKALENGDRESFLQWCDDPVINWLKFDAKGKWSWIVVNQEEDLFDVMNLLHGDDWPEWRDYYGYRDVRFSFEKLDDALTLKLTHL